MLREQVIPRLKDRFQIERARMRVIVRVPAEHLDEARQRAKSHAGDIESTQTDYSSSSAMVTCSIEPGGFRDLDELARFHNGRIEVVSLAAVEEGGVHVQGAHENSPSSSQPNGLTEFSHPESRGEAAGRNRAEATAHPAQPRVAQARAKSEHESGKVDVVVPRTAIPDMPEEHASRKERFMELEAIEAGWQVELIRRGEAAVPEAVFFSPDGERVGAFARARQEALRRSKSNNQQT